MAALKRRRGADDRSPSNERPSGGARAAGRAGDGIDRARRDPRGSRVLELVGGMDPARLPIGIWRACALETLLAEGDGSRSTPLASTEEARRLRARRRATRRCADRRPGGPPALQSALIVSWVSLTSSARCLSSRTQLALVVGAHQEHAPLERISCVFARLQVVELRLGDIELVDLGLPADRTRPSAPASSSGSLCAVSARPGGGGACRRAAASGCRPRRAGPTRARLAGMSLGGLGGGGRRGRTATALRAISTGSASSARTQRERGRRKDAWWPSRKMVGRRIWLRPSGYAGRARPVCVEVSNRTCAPSLFAFV